MINFFPIIIIALFTLAALVCFACGETTKAFFYILSAAININILFLK